MRKSIIFILGFILIILVVGGVFLWFWPGGEEEIKGSPADYQVLETGEGKFIENKKAGLKVKVPSGWIVEKIDVMEGSIVMYSPDAEGMRPSGRVRPPLKSGCLIEAGAAYRETNLEELKNEIEGTHSELIMKFDEFSFIEINNLSVLENTFESVELGPGRAVYIPFEDRLIGFIMTSVAPDKEKCFQEFDEFLETVSIR